MKIIFVKLKIRFILRRGNRKISEPLKNFLLQISRHCLTINCKRNQWFLAGEGTNMYKLILVDNEADVREGVLREKTPSSSRTKLSKRWRHPRSCCPEKQMNFSRGSRDSA
jgi:hypothetical protein